MDYLQYGIRCILRHSYSCVLNLIINGLPSILNKKGKRLHYTELSFKPYYKWITFNTQFKLEGFEKPELLEF